MKSWEILLYALVVSTLQIKIFLDGLALSDHASVQYYLQHQLHEGWLWGRKIDLSDTQWRDFRGSLGALSAAMAGFVALSWTVRKIAHLTSLDQIRVTANIVILLGFIGALHGWYSIHVFTLSLLHFCLTQWLTGRKYGLALVWTFACALFLFIQATEGLPLGLISTGLASMSGGMLRWHIHYNLLLLRMLSFSSDMHWARTQRLETKTGHHAQGPKSKITQHLPMHMYSLSRYLLYCFYPPLYIAGPIITFNSFTTQHSPVSQARVSGITKIVAYALRWLAALLALEVLTHTMYFNCIAKTKAWPHLEQLGVRLNALHYAEGSYWVLVFMWLKFTVIWRFFRLVSMADGVDVPENMTRCVCNNYDVEGFWRNWHASYNQWLVRYIYVPLGGSRWRVLNVWVVFTFVALWHDLEWRLLGWAWIMALAMLPEMGAKTLSRAAWAQAISHTYIWRHLCAVAAAINILVLMTGNMVGFVVGVDGVGPLLAKILEDPVFVASLMATLFSAAQLMFALREWESVSKKRTQIQISGLDPDR